MLGGVALSQLRCKANGKCWKRAMKVSCSSSVGLGGNRWSQKPNNKSAKQTRAGEQRRLGDAGTCGWPSDQRAGLPGFFLLYGYNTCGCEPTLPAGTQRQRLLQERVCARMTSHRTHEECQFYQRCSEPKVSSLMIKIKRWYGGLSHYSQLFGRLTVS